MKTAVILASRMNSNRFPGKAMVNLNGRPMLWHVITRARRFRGVDMVLVAVPEGLKHKPITDYAQLLGCDTFSGIGIEEGDVLARVLAAARRFEVEVIVRVTHDCPLLDAEVGSKVVALAQDMARETKDPEAGVYASNVYPLRTFEKGLDCEAFTLRTLIMADRHTPLGPWREHVTPWMQSTGRVLKGSITSGNPQRARDNWCVDYPDDLKHVERIMRMQCA